MAEIRAPFARVLLALVAVSLIWGSTYLAIRVAIETLPPLVMAGARFVVSGAALLAWTRGGERITAAHWRSAVIVGGLLLLVSNGAIVWAEQTVDSGMAALIVSLVPAFMVLLDWLVLGGRRPRLPVATGIVAGLGGVALLVQPSADASTDPLGVAAILVASLAWAVGSVVSPRLPGPVSPVRSAGLQMLCGGFMQLAAGVAMGEIGGFDASAISARSVWATLYLIVFGSIIAFTAYLWLLRVATAELVGTHAYVNPVVAVFLGWALLDEPVGPRTLWAAAIIVTAVVVITRFRRR